jgi:hypothetical protein
MNIKGNLIKVVSIWIGAGELVAGKEKMSAMARKTERTQDNPSQ